MRISDLTPEGPLASLARQQRTHYAAPKPINDQYGRPLSLGTPTNIIDQVLITNIALVRSIIDIPTPCRIEVKLVAKQGLSYPRNAKQSVGDMPLAYNETSCELLCTTSASAAWPW